MSSPACLPNNWNSSASRLLFFPDQGQELEPLYRPDPEALRGRLCEVSGTQPSAQMSLAMNWVRELQGRGEIAAWIHCPPGRLHPPDIADAGVDLDRFLVVHVPDAHAITRVADLLLRSGSVGLVLLDMWDRRPKDLGWMNRLLGLAHKHESRVVCLTTSQRSQESLGSLVSLRLEPQLQWSDSNDGGHFTLSTTVVKDKRGNPQRHFEEVYRGPLGLR